MNKKEAGQRLIKKMMKQNLNTPVSSEMQLLLKKQGGLSSTEEC